MHETAIEAICNGTAYFISFFTPEREVNVDAPVKFIAKKEAKAGKNTNQAAI